MDTDTFKAHSVRGASTTTALAKGVSLQDILHTADWSAEFTFQRFYYRPEKENVYAHTLLNFEDKESGESNGTYVPSGRFGLYAIVGYVYMLVFGLDVPWRPSDNKADVAEGFMPLTYRAVCLDV